MSDSRVLEKKTTGVENALAGMKSELTSVNANMQTFPTMQRRADAMWAKINQEVIPRLNALDKKAPPVQPAQISAIIESQQKMLVSTAELRQQLGTLSDQAREISSDQWRIGDRILSPIVQKAAADALKPIHEEWVQSLRSQHETGRPSSGTAFVPGGVVLLTEPEIRTSVREGIVTVSGVVPNSEAKKSIIVAIEKINPRKVVAEGLTIKP